MMFLTKLMLLTASQTDADLSTVLEETKAVAEEGWLGVLTGGLSAAAGGITAAVVSAVIMALLFKPGDKR